MENSDPRRASDEATISRTREIAGNYAGKARHERDSDCASRGAIACSHGRRIAFARPKGRGGAVARIAAAELFGSSGNVLVDNVASNDTYGFSIAFGNSNILSGNNASGNVFFGFAVALSDSNTLTDTLSHGNTLVGLLIMDANNTVVSVTPFQSSRV